MEKPLQKLGFLLLGISAAAYAIAVISALTSSTSESPFASVIGLAFFGGCALLFGQALKDRLSNKEDDHYNKNVKQ